MQTMAFMGVRMSWDTLERKRLFAEFACSALRRASCSVSRIICSSVRRCSRSCPARSISCWASTAAVTSLHMMQARRAPSASEK